MTEKTKKILAVGVGSALCCALTVGIGLRFGGGVKIMQTEPNLSTESHAEVTVEPLTEIQIPEKKEVEEPIESLVEVTEEIEQELQPEPIKTPEPEKPLVNEQTELPENHTEDDVPESERNLETPPTYEPEQLVVTTPQTEPAMGETADTGTYIEGFGWVESGGEIAVTEANDMTENGNKIGIID